MYCGWRGRRGGGGKEERGVCLVVWLSENINPLSSHRVLWPPGGASNISFGTDDDKTPVRKNKMASNIFAEPDDPHAHRRNNPPGSQHYFSQKLVQFSHWTYKTCIQILSFSRICLTPPTILCSLKRIVPHYQPNT